MDPVVVAEFEIPVAVGCLQGDSGDRAWQGFFVRKIGRPSAQARGLCTCLGPCGVENGLETMLELAIMD